MPPKNNLLSKVREAQEAAKQPSARAARSASTKKIPTHKGVEILQFREGEPSPNFGVWSEGVFRVAKAEFTLLLKQVFIDREYEEETEPIQPTAQEEAADAATGGYKRLKFTLKLKQMMTDRAEVEKMKPKLAAFLEATLSPESLIALENLPDIGATIRKSTDPLLLLEAIEMVHVSGFDANQTKMERKVKKVYRDLKQGPTEPLLVYLKRIELALRSFDMLEMERPSDEELVSDMYESIDQVRYSGHLKVLELKISDGERQEPANIRALYEYLIRRVTEESRPDSYVSPVDSAFVTDIVPEKPREEKQKKAAEPGGRNKGAKDQRNEKAQNPRDPGNSPASRDSGNPRTDKQKSHFTPRKPCPFCVGIDKGEDNNMHFPSDCPYLASCKEHIARECSKGKKASRKERATVAMLEASDDSDSAAYVAISDEVVAAVSTRAVLPTDMLFDCGSTVSVVHNRALVSGVCATARKHTVRGVGGKVAIDKQAMLGDWGRVLFCPSFGVNIMSQSRVVADQSLSLTYEDDIFTVTSKRTGKSLRFLPRGGLYVCNLLNPDAVSDVRDTAGSDDENEDVARAATVEENKLMYTKREVAEADAAADLVRALGYPSHRDMYRLLRGGIKGCPVTVQHYVRMLSIYDTPVAAIKGKTTRRAPAVLNTEYVPKPLVTDQTLFADLLYVEKIPFLTSVSEPLGMTICSHLQHGKGAAAMQRAMTHHIAQYSAQGFSVKRLVFDGEGAIGAIADHLGALGVATDQVAKGSHVGVVERKHRVIQERARAVKASLWFTLPRAFIVWLIYFCVTRINMMPSNTRVDPTSPRENFVRRKVDHDKDLCVGFGDYLQVHEHRAVTNTLDPRTQGAIALYPLGNLEGSIKVYLLESGRVVNRTHWTPSKAVPQDVVDKVNAIAAAEKAPAANAPAFEHEDGAAVPAAPGPPPHGEPHPLAHLVPPAHMPAPITDLTPFQVATDAPESRAVPAKDDHQDPGALPTEPLAQESQLEQRYPPRSNRTDWRSRTHFEHTVNHVTVKKALNKHGKKALRSMYEEMSQMPEKGVFTPQDPSKLSRNQMRRVIMSSMFLKEKFLSTGEFEKLKARLVAGGHQQDKSLYDDVSSPTVSTSSAFMIAALAARELRHIVTVDIAGAYLNAEMSGEEVLMRLDPMMSAILVKIKPEYKRFLCDDSTMIVKLDKALYGCIESAKLWYEDIAKTLKDLGYVRNPVDPCVFNKGKGKDQVTVCLHVDDLMITCARAESIEALLRALEAKYKTLTVHRGRVHSYLGMTFDFTAPNKVRITMEGYVKDVLEGYKVTGTAATPASVHLFDIRESEDLSAAQSKEYHSRVAKLLYLAKRVRPDILTAISFLSTRTKSATEDDYSKLDRVLRYLNGTAEMGMVLEATKDICVYTFADAAYGVHADGKSHSGLNITLGRGAVFMRSAKQKIVSKSSTEAELIGLSDSLSQTIWTRDFLIGQGYSVGPATVYQDNMSAIALAAKGKSTSDRTRHIHIRYFFVKDRVDAGEIAVEYKPTKLMLADILTKPLQGDLFRAMRKELLNWE